MKIPPIKKDRTGEVVEKFYYAIKDKKPQKLKLSDYLTFRLMQTVYERLKDMSPYDYKYWSEKGWFDKKTKYFHKNIKYNYFKDAIARFLGWVMGRQMDKGFSEMK